MRVAAILPVIALLVTADARKCKAKHASSSSVAIAEPTPSAEDNTLVHVPSNGTEPEAPTEASPSPTPSPSPSAAEESSSPSPTPSPAAESQSASPTPSPAEESPSPSPTEAETPAVSETPKPEEDGHPNPNPEGALSLSDPTAASLLEAHNKIRKEYGVPEVTWNDELSAKAVGQSQTCNFANLFPDIQTDYTDIIWANDNGDFASTIAAAGQEGENYDYANPGFQQAASHWTQIVWKATTEIGCGWHKCEEWADKALNGQFKLVCWYNTHQTYIAGNQAFIDNIPAKPE